MPSQPPISPRVLPQPTQNPVSGSITHTLMQGVSISCDISAFMGIRIGSSDGVEGMENGIVLLENAMHIKAQFSYSDDRASGRHGL